MRQSLLKYDPREAILIMLMFLEVPKIYTDRIIFIHQFKQSTFFEMLHALQLKVILIQTASLSPAVAAICFCREGYYQTQG